MEVLRCCSFKAILTKLRHFFFSYEASFKVKTTLRDVDWVGIEIFQFFYYEAVIFYRSSLIEGF